MILVPLPLGLSGGFHNLSEVWAPMSPLREAVPGHPPRNSPPSPLPHAPPPPPPGPSVLFTALTGTEHMLSFSSLLCWSVLHHKNLMPLNRGLFCQFCSLLTPGTRRRGWDVIDIR